MKDILIYSCIFIVTFAAIYIIMTVGVVDLYYLAYYFGALLIFVFTIGMLYGLFRLLFPIKKDRKEDSSDDKDGPIDRSLT